MYGGVNRRERSAHPQMGAGQESRLLRIVCCRAGNETKGFPLDGWRERGSSAFSLPGWPVGSQGMPIIILFPFILSLSYSISLICYNPLSFSIAIFPCYFF